MWLINTKTLKLEHAIDPEESNMKYAILSHTWEHEEVTFQQFQDIEQARKMAGFAKIQNTCRLAQNQGLDYVWIDTCCIDKSSSAELSEAINSMFSYYQLADTCYAYLSDLPNLNAEDLRLLEEACVWEEKARASYVFQVLSKCRWFTRGWTLQELIAPLDVQFYNAKWNCIGTKRTIPSVLSLITGIDDEILMNTTDLLSIPVCARMSWAANRETTRVEDIAYCLLGIFDVYLPLIYGEGYKAFQRLQEEIVRTSGDVTILAWSSHNHTPRKYLPTPYKDSKPPIFRGPFAWSPSEFAGNSSQSKRDPLKSIPIQINIVNGAVEVFATGDLPLRDLDDHGQLYLAIPGSGTPRGPRMMMTPLGYAIICSNELQGTWSSSIYRFPLAFRWPVSKIRIVNHQDAVRMNRNNLRLAPYLLKYDLGPLDSIAPRAAMTAWPARYFDHGCYGFIFTWPRVYPTQPAHILGLVACPVSITLLSGKFRGAHDLDFVFCCGAFARDPLKKEFKPWGIAFCKQSTDGSCKGMYRQLQAKIDMNRIRASSIHDQDELWEDTSIERRVPSFRVSITRDFSHNMGLTESLVDSLQHKTYGIEPPSTGDFDWFRKPFLQYTIDCSAEPYVDSSESIFKFTIKFQALADLEAEHPPPARPKYRFRS